MSGEDLHRGRTGAFCDVKPRWREKGGQAVCDARSGMEQGWRWEEGGCLRCKAWVEMEGRERLFAMQGLAVIVVFLSSFFS